MAEIKSVNKTEILSDFADQGNLLKQQIDILNQRILALQGHIVTLEQTNNVLEQMAKTEKDVTQRSRLYGAIRNNIELLAKLYSVIKEFEDVRFRYYKEIDDVLFNKYKLVAVDIRRLEEKINDLNSGDLVGFFEKLSSVLSNTEKRERAISDLDDKPEYRL